MPYLILQQHPNQHYSAYQIDENGQWLNAFDMIDLTNIPISVDNQQLIVLLPGSSVLMTQVRLPKTRHAEQRKAIPFAIEEQLATDVDNLHFALGQRSPFAELTVAVIDKAILNEQLEHLAQANLQPMVVLPDYLALPWHDEQWTIAFDQTMAQVRYAKDQGFSVDQANLISILALQIEKTNPTPDKIVLLSTKNIKTEKIENIQQSLTAALKLPIKIQTVTPETGLAIHELCQNPPINLLQGAFRPKVKRSTHPHYWKKCLASFCIFLMALLGGRLLTTWYLNHKAYHFQQQTAQLYQTIFPSTHSLTDPQIKAKQLLKELNREARGSQFLLLLAQTGAILYEQKSILLQSLQFQNNVLILQVQASTVSALENFTRAVTQRGFKVKQKQLTTHAKTVDAELQIKGD